MPINVEIRNFKSIEHLRLTLEPLTILLGPPASGKSNILDAIALAGYFNRLLFLKNEYGNNVNLLEPVGHIARFLNVQQLFKAYELDRQIVIDIKNGKGRTSLKLFYTGGTLNVLVNNVQLQWSLSPQLNVQSVLPQVQKANSNGSLFEARVYGYDRYGLASLTCNNIFDCGFINHLAGTHSVNVPQNILGEHGQNITFLTKKIQRLIIELNRMLRERLGMEIYLQVHRSGKITLFDYYYEVEPTATSDAVFRTLYYLAALHTSINYTKLHGLEGRFIVLLEEPEAHVFPFFLDLLADYITKATAHVYVVLTTHNPLLVSMLWDRVGNVVTYYVHRDESGSTRVARLDVKRLAEELSTIEDILYMPPSKVVKEFCTDREEVKL